ncbi:MAG: hypothetical protein GJT30_14135 [Geobacter sp.]|nr:hypothetical protein [Geobacter sp.]
MPHGSARPDRSGKPRPGTFPSDSFDKQLIDRVQAEAGKRKMQQSTF